MTLISKTEIDKALAQGERLRLLRKMAQFTASTLAEKIGVTETSILNWEKGRGTGLQAKNVERVVNALSSRVECSVEWIIDGIGFTPRLINDQILSSPQNAKDGYDTALIDSEIDTFLKVNPGSIVISAPDNWMEPIIYKNDKVGGCSINIRDINAEKPTLCIVKAKSDENFLIRYVTSSNTKNKFVLTCSKSSNEVIAPIEYNVSIEAIFLVVWIRRVL